MLMNNQLLKKAMADLDVNTPVGLNTDDSVGVKVELVTDIHEQVKLFHVDVNDFKESNKCNLCNKSFPWKSKLARHVKDVHDKLRDFKCDKCSYASSSY